MVAAVEGTENQHGQRVPLHEAARREACLVGHAEQRRAGAPAQEHVVHRQVEGEIEQLGAAIIRADPVAFGGGAQIGQGVAMAYQHALRLAGAAGGEQQVGAVAGRALREGLGRRQFIAAQVAMPRDIQQEFWHFVGFRQHNHEGPRCGVQQRARGLQPGLSDNQRVDLGVGDDPRQALHRVAQVERHIGVAGEQRPEDAGEIRQVPDPRGWRSGACRRPARRRSAARRCGRRGRAVSHRRRNPPSVHKACRSACASALRRNKSARVGAAKAVCHTRAARRGRMAVAGSRWSVGGRVIHAATPLRWGQSGTGSRPAPFSFI